MRTLVGAVVVVALSLLAPATAGADAASIKKVVAAQAKALENTGFEDTFTADAFIIGPEGLVPASNISALSDSIVGGEYSVIDKVKVKNLKIGLLEDAGWVTADFVVDTTTINPETQKESSHGRNTFRVTELVVKDGDAWKVRAAHFSSATSDKDAKELAKDEEIDPVPAAGTDVDPVRAWLESAAELLSLVDSDKAVTVIGSTAGEKAIGPAKVKKLLKKWKKLGFAVVGDVHYVETDWWAFAAANVALGKVTYRTLAIFRRDPHGVHLASIHYSVQW